MTASRGQREQSCLGAVVAKPEALEPQHPRNGALHDPAVPAQMGLGLGAAPGDPNLDAPPIQVAAAPRVVVTLVRVQLLRPAARLPWTTTANAHCRIGLQQRLKELAVVRVGC